MVDGVLLLVDAFEGPMPQTRFVLQKALELKLPVIVVINKVDRPDARSRRSGGRSAGTAPRAGRHRRTARQPHRIRFGPHGYALRWIPMQRGRPTCARCSTPSLPTFPRRRAIRMAPLQMLISTIDYNDYVGRIGVGRIERGTHAARVMMAVRCTHEANCPAASRLAGLYTFDGLKRVPCESAPDGRYRGHLRVSTSWPSATPSATRPMPEPLPFVKICRADGYHGLSRVNDSPFAGHGGAVCHLAATCARVCSSEMQTDVSLRVEDTEIHRRVPRVWPGRIAPFHLD